VVAGQFGNWTPIGTEQTATGNEVVWKITGADDYTVWNTDGNGNYRSSSALESLENSFHEDLNGDGAIGVPTKVIEDFGTTSLVEAGNNFYLDTVSSGTGPELQYGGMAVVAGQLGSGRPSARNRRATGYEVAWKIPGADDYISNAVGVVSGSNSALESLETSFHQDLNGDGAIGPTTIAAGATTEIPSAFSGAITFAGSTGTLQLDSSSSFSGTVAGLAGQDTLDMRDINSATVQSPTYSGSASGGSLTVTDGTHIAKIALLGNYLASSFVTSSDGHGGTAIVDPLLTSSNQQTILTQSQHA
jgi:hypothetical protein